MIEAIDKKYCTDNLVQLMPYTDEFHLITSADEIILLKTKSGILINKYSNHPNRYLFPFSEKEQCDKKHFTELFEYNKLYLNFRFSTRNYKIHKNYFFKGNNKALLLEESLPTQEKYTTQELSRDEITEIFNNDNYDAMYIIGETGNILFAKNDKEKLNINKFTIPNNEEIINMELEIRRFELEKAFVINHINYLNRIKDYETKKQKIIDTVTKRKIEDIENFEICGPCFLLTIKDGKFDLKKFTIIYNENKFKLTTSPIKIIEPTMEDLLLYYKKHDIEYVLDPNQYSDYKVKIKSL